MSAEPESTVMWLARRSQKYQCMVPGLSVRDPAESGVKATRQLHILSSRSKAHVQDLCSLPDLQPLTAQWTLFQPVVTHR